MQIEIQLVGDFRKGTVEQIKQRIIEASRIVDDELVRYGLFAGNVRNDKGELIAKAVTH